MKLDIHITTCHRHDVKCRPRPPESPMWNVREWTHEERLGISKYSVESIIRFVNLLRSHGVEVNLSLLDDGSNIPEAVAWICSLEDKLKIYRYPHRGSSAGINDYTKALDCDYVMHVEDDHILFNPNNINWLEIIHKIRKSSDNIKVFTFRSGLPVSVKDKGYNGAWGPIGSSDAGDIHSILFRKMGNAHHIMSLKDYEQFLPLQGSTGGCEAFMNTKLEMLGLNAEPQIHVHAFHSHMYSYPINTNNLSEWHKTGEGFEFGIKDMFEYLDSKNSVMSSLFETFPNKKLTSVLGDYAF